MSRSIRVRQRQQRCDLAKQAARRLVVSGSLPYWLFLLVGCLALTLGLPLSVRADDPLPEILKAATFEQRLGEPVPLDTGFSDETGQTVTLSDYVGDKPLILTLNYYECPNLCPLALDGLVTGLEGVPFTIGKEFEIVTVSINPREGPELAAQTKQRYVQRYGRPSAADGWHFLTGEQSSIDRLAQAVGFNYAYDEEQNQYAHPSGIIVLTPQGKIARYIYGMEFAPRDLRLALVEASEGKIGSPVDQVLLFCYRYNSTVGKYTPVAFLSLRLAAAATVGVLALFLVRMWRRESRRGETGSAEEIV